MTQSRSAASASIDCCWGSCDSILNVTGYGASSRLVQKVELRGWCRKSQIQTFLEQNEGPGLQHLAIMTNDIFTTLRELRKRSSQGGFDFMPPASQQYYQCVDPVALKSPQTFKQI